MTFSWFNNIHSESLLTPNFVYFVLIVIQGDQISLVTLPQQAKSDGHSIQMFLSAEGFGTRLCDLETSRSQVGHDHLLVNECDVSKPNKFELVNAFHAAGECRWQDKNVTHFVKNINIVEFHGQIWNHNEKCI